MSIFFGPSAGCAPAPPARTGTKTHSQKPSAWGAKPAPTVGVAPKFGPLNGLSEENVAAQEKLISDVILESIISGAATVASKKTMDKVIAIVLPKVQIGQDDNIILRVNAPQLTSEDYTKLLTWIHPGTSVGPNTVFKSVKDELLNRLRSTPSVGAQPPPDAPQAGDDLDQQTAQDARNALGDGASVDGSQPQDVAEGGEAGTPADSPAETPAPPAEPPADSPAETPAPPAEPPAETPADSPAETPAPPAEPPAETPADSPAETPAGLSEAGLSEAGLSDAKPPAGLPGAGTPGGLPQLDSHPISKEELEQQEEQIQEAGMDTAAAELKLEKALAKEKSVLNDDQKTREVARATVFEALTAVIAAQKEAANTTKSILHDYEQAGGQFEDDSAIHNPSDLDYLSLLTNARHHVEEASTILAEMENEKPT